ncbi:MULTISPECIES: glycoside hydrolase family 38 C-terminal domain-containing protein [Sphingobacterium]|uniref:Glycoside hydrolase family 38 C-terminal domain-containing protein n=1 Tax=Sphingobacterium populi TaxID=1812824 RepID=A0ABW5UBL0_9SPHI|nr:glycoside hydrolase family 38 C-terminal domain-containing protein [Sphingobacterium sp. CFCC 11742]
MMLPFVRTSAQTAYFIDGYHGGKWGHYPKAYTSFVADQLEKHPHWRINLEIEPETWDWAREVDPKGYQRLKKMIADQSENSRVEFVNPTYGQPYLYNISGESIIRQFEYGIALLDKHFPNLSLETYSSEEPCFTSALPGILRSFGFQYASLKSPNTCWGGYVLAHGGELLDWVGPDGSSILTVPRYGIETLKEGSTWETTGYFNKNDFIHAALNDGIRHPLGMCLQDAGWDNGPWLGKNDGEYKPTEYTTWSNYFKTIKAAGSKSSEQWRFSQEDLQVSLVWGAQVLQRIAQQVRQAENRMVYTEKSAAFDHLKGRRSYPTDDFRRAWQPLMLAQHHDCWIVPYNRVDSLTWAGKVTQWTNETNAIADAIESNSNVSFDPKSTLIVQNLQAYDRTDIAEITFPNTQLIDTNQVVVDRNGKPVLTQWEANSKVTKLLFEARVAALSEASFRLKPSRKSQKKVARIEHLGSTVRVVMPHQAFMIDLQRGGVITSFKSNSTELIPEGADGGWNQLKGFFYDQGEFRSSTENSAKVEVVELGSLQGKIRITGKVDKHTFTQEILIAKDLPGYKASLQIDWAGQPSIGKYDNKEMKLADRDKAFYNNKYKLQLLFPTNLKNQNIAKDAPFDVTESRLENTFFDSWDSIKNNIVLNWVDVTDGDSKKGLALFTDHTTSYAHGADHPLGLTVQYVGKGLWGMDYTVDGPTTMEYQVYPHDGNWYEGNVWAENDRRENPLYVKLDNSFLDKHDKTRLPKPLIRFEQPGYVLSALRIDNYDLVMRVYNSSGTTTPLTAHLWLDIEKVVLEELDQTVIQPIAIDSKRSSISLHIPKFGFQNVRIKLK